MHAILSRNDVLRLSFLLGRRRIAFQRCFAWRNQHCARALQYPGTCSNYFQLICIPTPFYHQLRRAMLVRDIYFDQAGKQQLIGVLLNGILCSDRESEGEQSVCIDEAASSKLQSKSILDGMWVCTPEYISRAPAKLRNYVQWKAFQDRAKLLASLPHPPQQWSLPSNCFTPSPVHMYSI